MPRIQKARDQGGTIMGVVRIRVQGQRGDIAKLKDILESCAIPVEWGLEAQDFTKAWAKTPNVPTNKIRVYGVIKW
jgi:hypothetical protein